MKYEAIELWKIDEHHVEFTQIAFSRLLVKQKLTVNMAIRNGIRTVAHMKCLKLVFYNEDGHPHRTARNPLHSTNCTFMFVSMHVAIRIIECGSLGLSWAKDASTTCGHRPIFTFEHVSSSSTF